MNTEMTQTLTEALTLRDYLNDLLLQKKARNSAYSIRALARDLKVDQSHLTRVLKGKMRATPLIAFRTGMFLNLSSEETVRLISLTLQ